MRRGGFTPLLLSGKIQHRVPGRHAVQPAGAAGAAGRCSEPGGLLWAPRSWETRAQPAPEENHQIAGGVCCSPMNPSSCGLQPPGEGELHPRGSGLGFCSQIEELNWFPSLGQTQPRRATAWFDQGQWRRSQPRNPFPRLSVLLEAPSPRPVPFVPRRAPAQRGADASEAFEPGPTTSRGRRRIICRVKSHRCHHLHNATRSRED